MLLVAFLCTCSVGAHLCQAQESLKLTTQAIGILKQRCMPCHGSDNQEGGLRLDSYANLVRGGERGSGLELDSDGAVKPESLLLRSIQREDEEFAMPPEFPLPEAEQNLLSQGMLAGATWPESDSESLEWSERLVAPEKDSFVIEDVWSHYDNPVRRVFPDERWNHWAYLPRKKISIPDVTDSSWPINPIDTFLLADWEKSGRSPAREVDRRQWLRRLSFDLIGLPPTMEEVKDFVADSSNDAYEKQIERLLQHSGHGEHWGRMWLDVVRYSDSNGFDWDEFRPEAWRYRDYVIAAFRDDKPFDQFIREQLAGDELFDGPPESAEEQAAWIATGFLRMGPHDNAAPLFNEQERSRDEWLADLVETTGHAFLGLTFSCCRCHDHKTDPLLQADHFRMRAFFAGVTFADDQPIDLPEQYQRIEKRRGELSEQVEKLRRELERLDELSESELAEDDKTEIKKTLQERIAKLEKEKPDFAHAISVRDQSEIPETYVLAQGDYRKPTSPVSPGFPAMWRPFQAARSVVKRAESSGRRSALANWIADPDNPLTARVIVNRIWQNYFGEGLVGTPNDFGVTGQTPQHRELLDWLAEELIRADWSLRRIHWLIATSRAYRLQAVAMSGTEQTIASPRGELKRLTAEQLRDAILMVSAQLIPKEGGPPVWPDLPPEILQSNPALLDDNVTRTKGWYPSSAEQQPVRSIYLIQKRTVPIPYMETFDLPENSVSCGRRSRSIVAPQALALLNSEMMEQAAVSLAARLKATEVEESIKELFAYVLQREPTVSELRHCVRYIEDHGATALARVLLNLNEFLFID